MKKPKKPTNLKADKSPAVVNHAGLATRADSVAKFERIICDALGVKEPQIARELLGQASALQVWGTLKSDEDKIVGALPFSVRSIQQT